jgi:hypothetical protein
MFGRLACQEISLLLRNTKIHSRIHKSPSLAYIHKQPNTVHTLMTYICKICVNTVLSPYKEKCALYKLYPSRKFVIFTWNIFQDCVYLTKYKKLLIYSVSQFLCQIRRLDLSDSYLIGSCCLTTVRNPKRYTMSKETGRYLQWWVGEDMGPTRYLPGKISKITKKKSEMGTRFVWNTSVRTHALRQTSRLDLPGELFWSNNVTTTFIICIPHKILPGWSNKRRNVWGIG